jgi:hypothetical protein
MPRSSRDTRSTKDKNFTAEAAENAEKERVKGTKVGSRKGAKTPREKTYFFSLFCAFAALREALFSLCVLRGEGR